MRLMTFVAFALFSASAQSAPYLGLDQIDLTVLLPPPPGLGSDENRQDLAAVLAAQATRTPEQAAQTVHDAEETVFVQFAEAIGPKFTLANLPRVAAMFDRIGETEDGIVDPSKKVFARLRPFLASSDVHPSAPLTRSGSWPSGHAARVTMSAIVLARMVPEYRLAIFQRATAYAWNRVVGGVHYPSDLDVGKRAGTAMAALLLNEPAFREDYGPARLELRHALGLSD